MFLGDKVMKVICNNCNGSGEAIDPKIKEVNICTKCNGKGFMLMTIDQNRKQVRENKI